MQDTRELTSEITIEAPAEDVWEAITDPERIKEWFFGVDTITDWTEGGSIVHKGEWQGKPYEDKGEVVKVERPKTLIHTHWSSMSGLPDAPENYQEVRWSLATEDGRTTLSVSEDNIPSEEAREMSEKTWKTVLTKLKEILER
jgi:uncharacterized protein YndB with AHSA1/START domain